MKQTAAPTTRSEESGSGEKETLVCSLEEFDQI